MARKPGLTKGQHLALGADLARIQDEINAAICQVGAAYLSNSKEVKALERIARAIELARSVMDDGSAIDAYYPADAGRAGACRWSA
jgi:hypothetical protein